LKETVLPFPGFEDSIPQQYKVLMQGSIKGLAFFLLIVTNITELPFLPLPPLQHHFYDSQLLNSFTSWKL
jgi:hypothetical protein